MTATLLPAAALRLLVTSDCLRVANENLNLNDIRSYGNIQDIL